MSQRIFKWNLMLLERQKIAMPIGSRILSVQMSGDQAMLWAVCNDDRVTPQQQRTILMYRTGDPLPFNLGDYLGTLQGQREGHRHVFEAPVIDQPTPWAETVRNWEVATVID